MAVIMHGVNYGNKLILTAFLNPNFFVALHFLSTRTTDIFTEEQLCSSCRYEGISFLRDEFLC